MFNKPKPTAKPGQKIGLFDQNQLDSNKALKQGNKIQLGLKKETAQLISENSEIAVKGWPQKDRVNTALKDVRLVASALHSEKPTLKPTSKK